VRADGLLPRASGRMRVRTRPGTDVDTMYGQILRRMPIAEDASARFAVVVPDRALNAALRVSARVRRLLRVDVYSVTEDNQVNGPVS
jgi:hypothetical protein